MRPRATFLERVTQFRDCLRDGRIHPDENYSADELSTILRWDPSTVKRVLPAIVAARDISENLAWEQKQVGGKKFYSFRATVTKNKG